jgi:hypothetical protein
MRGRLTEPGVERRENVSGRASRLSVAHDVLVEHPMWSIPAKRRRPGQGFWSQTSSQKNRRSTAQLSGGGEGPARRTSQLTPSDAGVGGAGATTRAQRRRQHRARARRRVRRRRPGQQATRHAVLPTQVSGRTQRMAARRASLGHLHLATHPGAGMLDRLTRSWVLRLSRLEEVKDAPRTMPPVQREDDDPNQ